jgi:toxin ParE1/3/4
LIRYSPKAEDDLRDITDWIADTNGPAVSERVIRMIIASIRRLDTFPRLGRSGRVEGTREPPIAGLPFIAVYRPLLGEIAVFRVIHRAMRWPPSG